LKKDKVIVQIEGKEDKSNYLKVENLR